MNQRTAWEAEYAQPGTRRIESSYSWRPEPSVKWFLSFLKRQGLASGRLLDLGSGRGRNAFPFLEAGWSVTCLDVVAAALRDFQERAGAFDGQALGVQGDLGRPLPFPTGGFDAVMEITAADNLTRRRVRDRFWREAVRVLRPGGWLFTYHFSPADGYYGPLLRDSAWRQSGLLYDRRAHMRFRFYGAPDILAATRGRLEIVRRKSYRYPGPMFGATYLRELEAVIFRRA